MENIPSTMMSNAMMIIIKYALLFIFIFVRYVCLVGFNNLSEYTKYIYPELTLPIHLIRFDENRPARLPRNWE